MLAHARGEIAHFTGFDDPYEAPEDPEIKLDAIRNSAGRNAGMVLGYLFARRFLPGAIDQFPERDDGQSNQRRVAVGRS